MASKAMQGPLWLLNNGSATSEAQKWPGGRGVFMSQHTGGTVTLEYMLPGPGSVWVAAGTDTTLAASGGGVFYLPDKTLVRAAVAGATAVYATVNQVG